MFVVASHIRRHKHINIGDKPHHFDVCGKIFTRERHLLKHTLIHTGALPHSCLYKQIHTGDNFINQIVLMCLIKLV